MEFPKEFFLDEVREGFYIPAMMKRAWAAELEILATIDEICERHQLHYYLDYGTLLGAIRHKGFIPWDDDIDIMMMREDYEVFAKVAKAELPEELVFRSLTDGSNNYELVSSVQHKQMLISSPSIGKYHNYLYGAGVDIFPYDYLSDDEEQEKERLEIYKSLCILASFPSLQGDNKEVLEQEAKKIKDLCAVDLFHSSHYRKTVLALLQEYSKKFNSDRGHKISYLLDLVLFKNQGIGIFEEEWYCEESYLNFEFLSLPVPKEYRKIIAAKFHDYETIRKGGGDHEYPFYRKMEAEYMEGIGGKLFYQYSINKEDLRKRTNTDSLSLIGKNTTERQKPRIYFFPGLHSRWNSMRGLFEVVASDKEVDCFVVPIPYYFKNGLGACSPAQWDFSLYEKELGQNSPFLLDFRSLNLKEASPDMIFINEPSDEYNLNFMSDPVFFSKNLKQFTKNLIYIPWFLTSEIDIEDEEDGKAIINAENYVIMPTLVHCDYAILQSDAIEKLYRRLLEREGGAEYANYWKEKLLPWGSPLFDKISGKELHSSPEIWRKLKDILT